MSNGDDPVLDPRTVLRSFSSKLRGYDGDEVDAHLRRIAEALRVSARNADDGGMALTAARATIDDLNATILALESEIDDVGSPGSGEPFDEARAMQLLGEETTRVLETARKSAATIVANAEAEAERRTKEVDAIQARVNTELTELRKQVDNELADRRASEESELAELRERTEAETAERIRASKQEAEETVASASSEAETMLAEARSAADKLAVESEKVASAAREQAAEVTSTADAEAARLRVEAKEEAATIRGEAETDAARVRAESEADVLAAQESARETARLMVVEAQRVREKVLNDLVVRRRQGRQHVDQAKAARDRLGRALQDVRRQLDGSIKELDVALPEAKAALSALATPDAPIDDEAQIRELEIELDAARARAATPDAVVASGSAALAPARGKAKTKPKTERAEKSEAGQQKPSEQAEPADSAVDSHTATTAVVEAETDAETDEPEAVEIEVPEPFLSRDVAMTRHGADLRRKLKRVMADEQSDLLDRLQRSKQMSVADLASFDEQRRRYVDAVSPAIHATAVLGAAMHDGTIAKSRVEPLVERLVDDVFQTLRSRVEDSVEAAADVDDVLEPLRAHYRDVRLTDVPGLTDDVLAEAFALGAYDALATGVPVQWVSDPRFEPNSDCFDDTLADDVVKPDAFPTGRTHPTGQPGCRCLVVPRG
jgi:DivIVA domain-containing protein